MIDNLNSQVKFVFRRYAIQNSKCIIIVPIIELAIKNSKICIHIGNSGII